MPDDVGVTYENLIVKIQATQVRFNSGKEARVVAQQKWKVFDNLQSNFIKRRIFDFKVSEKFIRVNSYFEVSSGLNLIR